MNGLDRIGMIGVAMLIAGLATLLGMACAAAIDRATTDAYRQGQIDYANGIIKYQLQPLPTGETVWKKASE